MVGAGVSEGSLGMLGGGQVPRKWCDGGPEGEDIPAEFISLILSDLKKINMKTNYTFQKILTGGHFLIAPREKERERNKRCQKH